jgi:hypothetical protein
MRSPPDGGLRTADDALLGSWDLAEDGVDGSGHERADAEIGRGAAEQPS